MTGTAQRPDVEQICSRLKDFQRRSVDYVVRRFFDDPDRVDRFLLADEVGLGKTLVAKGVVAHAVNRLWEKVPRIDVVYVCSNAAIARQNIDRLRLDRDDEFTSPTRMTLLPLHAKDFSRRKLNFVSFTPATSFDLGGSTGIKQERMLLYYLLRDAWDLRGVGAKNVLRGDVGAGRWRESLDEFGKALRRREGEADSVSIDPGLASAYLESIGKEEGLRAEFEALCQEFGHDRERWPDELRRRRNKAIGRLRRVLAKTCISALEPDVVVLDEFQRFKHLLAGDQASEEDREVAELASDLFQYRTPAGQRAKVLLLSATPYKMYTLAGEGENHYEDFIATARFLLDSAEETKKLEEDLAAFRDSLCSDGRGSPEMLKGAVENRLRRVMCRTERLGMSVDRNGMIAEQAGRASDVQAKDVTAFRAIAGVARGVEAGDCVEMWKSSPYLLNLMDDQYELKRKVVEGIDDEDEDLLADLRRTRATLLDGPAIEEFRELDPGNARVRALLDSTVRTGAWKLLWMPAAAPYYAPRGPFADPAVSGFTKTLVFSAWHVVPKAIAMLASYEAERLMVRAGDDQVGYRDLRLRHRGPLRFAEDQGRLAGMAVLTHLYPCATLARRVDPLAISAHLAAADKPVTAESVLAEARRIIEPLITPDLATAKSGGPVDESWYWAAPMLLDHRLEPGATKWFIEGDDAFPWYRDEDESDVDTAEQRHLERAEQFLNSREALGPPPPDLLDVLALVALGSPAVAVLRALSRQWPRDLVSAPVLAAAACGASGFRSLYNRPETVTLLKGLDAREPYWERALEYGVSGNIQAVVDEFVHALRDHMSLNGHPATAAFEIGERIHETASLTAVSLGYDLFDLPENGPVTRVRRTCRCRFALRFGQGKDQAEEEGKEARDDQVRNAFNSPFRPFVLASTSVGQEGLDFHLYCHRVMHWNVPSNPVDLEQREGRIHRYKGHVVRRNLASGGLRPSEADADPWSELFAAAAMAREARSDLVPYWVCEGKHRIERVVPMFPLSREEAGFDDLKRSMALYRLVFGQPRQEDLLKLVAGRERSAEEVEQWRIDLSPRFVAAPGGAS